MRRMKTRTHLRTLPWLLAWRQRAWRRPAGLTLSTAPLLALCLLGTPAPAQAASVETSPPSSAAEAAALPRPPGRPRIGLVLSGGGARGLAHVGVLKVLERLRVPVDVVAGTSMGAIIGGLYASGMSAEELDRELRKVDWNNLFNTRVDRQELSQRRKEEDFEISPVIEIGMRNGELRAPLGALSGRGLETLLRRYTLPVRDINDFDALPLPFRAVATDMENGQTLVLGQGDLALALRSSMSVPGVFSPTESDGRILGDGGLVNNVPIDVARAMGADRVIVVNIGTPLAGREALASVAGLSGQMINILTEQNVQRSLATLRPGDVLISPDLAKLTSGDFNKAGELMDRGQAGAEALTQQLAGWAISDTDYARWREARSRPPTVPTKLAQVRYQGSEITHPERFAALMASKPGQVFDTATAERDARRLASTGDYERVDYLLEHRADGDGLVFDLEDKPWGPHYFRIGLDLSTDFNGRGDFNVKISHNRHWLDEAGTEWRNQVRIGQSPRWSTELYHPLAGKLGSADDWFVSAHADIERQAIAVYNSQSGLERGRFLRTNAATGIDLGQPWAELGELRLGVEHLLLRNEPQLLSSDYTGPSDATSLRETGLRAQLVIDQLDFANFPQRGYRAQLMGISGYRREATQAGGATRYNRLDLQGTRVGTWGAHTLSALGRLQLADQPGVGTLGRYTLGGFHQLSGYQPGQIDGNALLFGRLTYYRRMQDAPVFTRGLFIGGTLEAGNAWARSSQLGLNDLRLGTSAFIGADTGLGPLYLGLTWAPKGSAGIYLFLGRP
jgi:NTE family protein